MKHSIVGRERDLLRAEIAGRLLSSWIAGEIEGRAFSDFIGEEDIAEALEVAEGVILRSEEF